MSAGFKYDRESVCLENGANLDRQLYRNGMKKEMKKKKITFV